MEKVVVRKALTEDVDLICHVHHSAVLALEGGPYRNEILSAWAGTMTPEAIRQGMAIPEIIGFVGEIDGEVVGLEKKKENLRSHLLTIQ